MSISTVGLFFIPLFVKINNMEQQTDVFIPDGMNAFQRNVKRVGGLLDSFRCAYRFFSFVFVLLSCRETGRWRASYFQAGTNRPFRETFLYL